MNNFSEVQLKTLLINSSSSDSPSGSSMTRWERLEAQITKLSSRSNFWHRVCSFIWFPLVFRSGISVRHLGSDEYVATLPFKRGNRNFYKAMAGAALLGNSEVAAGVFLFNICGSEYEVVCRKFSYKFLRPCYGAASYTVKNAEEVRNELRRKIASAAEFNVTVEMQITQETATKNARALRIGKSELSFHCTPKAIVKQRRKRRKDRRKA